MRNHIYSVIGSLFTEATAIILCQTGLLLFQLKSQKNDSLSSREGWLWPSKEAFLCSPLATAVIFVPVPSSFFVPFIFCERSSSEPCSCFILFHLIIEVKRVMEAEQDWPPSELFKINITLTRFKRSRSSSKNILSEENLYFCFQVLYLTETSTEPEESICHSVKIWDLSQCNFYFSLSLSGTALQEIMNTNDAQKLHLLKQTQWLCRNANIAF